MASIETMGFGDAMTFGEYWLLVLGESCDARIVSEYGLSDGEGLDEWLDTCESAAWSAGGIGGPVPDSWSEHHERAKAKLLAAIGGES
jgi:hypothetical protein